MVRNSILIVLMFLGFALTAQTNEAAPENISRSNIENLLVTNQTPVNNGFVNNSIIIQQVGQGNLSFVSVASTSSLVSVNQNGNGNDVAISLRGNNIAERVAQVGNNNSVRDFSRRDASGAGLDVLQNGNNLSLERYGANSATGGIKVRQSGNGSGQPLIIRQFN